MEAFVIASGHRIARGADVKVMNAQMFGPEMRIKHGGQKKIGQAAFHPRLLVHQFVGIVDPDGSRNHAHAEEQSQSLGRAKMGGAGDIPKHDTKKGELDGKPDQRDRAIPGQLVVGRLRIGVRGVVAGQGIQKREQEPCAGRDQKHGPAANDHAKNGNWWQAERQPERQGMGKRAHAGSLAQSGGGSIGDMVAGQIPGLAHDGWKV